MAYILQARFVPVAKLIESAAYVFFERPISLEEYDLDALGLPRDMTSLLIHRVSTFLVKVGEFIPNHTFSAECISCECNVGSPYARFLPESFVFTYKLTDGDDVLLLRISFTLNQSGDSATTFARLFTVVFYTL